MKTELVYVFSSSLFFKEIHILLACKIAFDDWQTQKLEKKEKKKKKRKKEKKGKARKGEKLSKFKVHAKTTRS